MNEYNLPPQNSWNSPMMDYTLIKNLEDYIHDEWSDSRYYEILAEKAPTPLSKELLLEFSRDEAKHAYNFIQVYRMLTGRCYPPPAIENPKVPDNEQALKERIIAETNDYKKYGEQYLRAINPYVKDLFFMTRTVEAQHAMRIPILMMELCCQCKE